MTQGFYWEEIYTVLVFWFIDILKVEYSPPFPGRHTVSFLKDTSEEQKKTHKRLLKCKP